MNHSQYRPDIDGLRAIAVGVVMAYHAFPSVVSGGFVGVDVFFVISGYLISGIILDGLNGGRFSFATFYARRVRRIFPALALVLGAVLVAGWYLLYADDYARLGRQAAAGAAFVSNFALWKESSYFDVAADLKPLLHLWSLGIEEQFYLIWPVMLVLASRWRYGPVGVTLIIGSVSFLLAIWTVRIDRTPAFFAPWTRFWELLAGALLAGIHRQSELDAWVQRQLTPGLRHAGAILGIIMIVAGVAWIDSTRVFPGLWVLLPVGGTALLIASGPDAVINRIVLSTPVLVWVGLISYPLYLWHWPLLSFAHLVEGHTPSPALRLVLLAISVVLAAATYYMIERPVRSGVKRRATVPALAIVMSLVGAAGLVLFSNDGAIDRPINRADAALLVDYYERMRKTGLADAYRRGCDFMDWTTEHTREALDASCTAGGAQHTVLLWGDSFAQALSLGIRESLPPGTALAQVTTSACPPQIDNFQQVREQRCEKANPYAMAAIERLRPDVVILAQGDGHAVTDWPRLTERVLSLGAGHVVIVGPSPTWRPGLPRVYGEHHLQDHAEYVAIGLNTERFAIDRAVADRVAGRSRVTYLSLLEHLCHDAACLARVPGESELDLMVLDFGHLTPKGSSYVGRAIWKNTLERLLR
jgi:peptidoglycan/LPS O-acetylase OafA/YrhL